MTLTGEMEEDRWGSSLLGCGCHNPSIDFTDGDRPTDPARKMQMPSSRSYLWEEIRFPSKQLGRLPLESCGHSPSIQKSRFGWFPWLSESDGLRHS